MNIYKKQTRYPKNIILNSSDGFSLTELIITVSIATFLIVIIVGIVMMLYNAIHKLNDNALKVYNISRLTDLVSTDVLNPDLFPHHPLIPVGDQSTDCYVLKNNEITFYANKGKVEYKSSDLTSDIKTFTIIKKDKKYSFKLLKSFNINYFDSKDFEIKDLTIFPSYCILNLTFYDNRKVSMKMKL
jgi:hypothetical protein